MQKEKTKTEVDIVGELNDWLFSKLDKPFYTNYPIQLSYCSTGYADRVDFLGIPIWSSENEERREIGDSGEYEPLEDFLKREVKEIIASLSIIK